MLFQMVWAVLNLLIVIFPRQFLAIGELRNVNYVYQGLSKLALAGDKLTIECPLTGPFYSWRLFQYNTESRVLLDQDSKNIIIESATTDKSGVYECKSTTGFGNAVKNITVKIIDRNKELSKQICSFRKTAISRDFLRGLCFFSDVNQNKVRFKVGSNVEFDCISVGRNLRYSWKFIGRNGVQVEIPKEDNVTKISITKIIPMNEGTYRCEVMDENGLIISRTFMITLADIVLESGIEVKGEKNLTYSLKYGDNVSLTCEIKNSYAQIHSIKWGKQVSDSIHEPQLASNVILWDNHNYRILPTSVIIETIKNPNLIINTLELTKVEETNSGVYICLVMNTLGGTAHKLFNVTVTPDIFADQTGKRSQLFFLYILSPAILIFICVSAIIYCFIRSNSMITSAMPLKQYSSSTPSNGNKTTTSNFYYPVTNTRPTINCPQIPYSTESQPSKVSPTTIASYASYGNYHFIPSNQPSCCKSNDV